MRLGQARAELLEAALPEKHSQPVTRCSVEPRSRQVAGEAQDAPRTSRCQAPAAVGREFESTFDVLDPQEPDALDALRP